MARTLASSVAADQLAVLRTALIREQCRHGDQWLVTGYSGSVPADGCPGIIYSASFDRIHCGTPQPRLVPSAALMPCEMRQCCSKTNVTRENERSFYREKDNRPADFLVVRISLLAFVQESVLYMRGVVTKWSLQMSTTGVDSAKALPTCNVPDLGFCLE